MKKMTKGAIVTGLGVALLLGGGGTLAVWNQDATSNPGTIAAGDLNLVAGIGSWSNGTETVDITNYKVVPGETLTYTQNLNVTLVGDKIEAVLTTDGITADSGFVAEDVRVSEPVLSTGTDVLTAAHSGKPVTATTTFEFLDRENQGRSSADASYDFSNVRYVLTQQNPNGASGI